jgi:hypothetical protein
MIANCWKAKGSLNPKETGMGSFFESGHSCLDSPSPILLNIYLRFIKYFN